MPVRTCELSTLVEILQGRESTGRVDVSIAGDWSARPELLARPLLERVPGVRVHPAEAFHDDRFTGLRVWLDDASGLMASVTAARARGERPGRWVAQLDAEAMARADAQERAKEAARDRADVVFAALDGFPGRVHVRFFYDYSDSPLWPQAAVTDPLEDLLPITTDLRDRVRTWTARMQAASRKQELTLEPEGRSLAAELQEQVGPGYRIEYRG